MSVNPTDGKKWDWARIVKYAAICFAVCLIILVPILLPLFMPGSGDPLNTNSGILTTLLNRYYVVKKEYPASLKELEDFGGDTKLPIENPYLWFNKTGYGQAYVDLQDLLPNLKWKSNNIYLKNCRGRVLYQPFLHQQAYRVLYCHENQRLVWAGPSFLGKEGKPFPCHPSMLINRKTLQVCEKCFMSEAEWQNCHGI